ncbi:MAG: FKBP-type peptidyl-prolyl cis-trans isomerase [Chthoniobacterales bacterium]
MKSFIIALASVLAVSPLPGQEKSPESKTAELKSDIDKVSYSIGLQVGFNFVRQNEALKKQNVQINIDAMMAGVKDAIAGKPQLSSDQVRQVLASFEKDMTQKVQATAQKNKTDGERFLAENKKKDGVKTTASGLQYKVIKEGNGPQPKETDVVTVNYRGTLIDGTEFDSSYKRGQPATFPLNGVIKGWTEGLQLMKAGGKSQFFIPANLAYGERQMGPDIGPDATLIFEVELLDAKAPGAGSSPSPTPTPR